MQNKFILEYYVPLSTKKKNLFFHLISPTRAFSDFVKLAVATIADTEFSGDEKAIRSARAWALKSCNLLYRVLSIGIVFSIWINSISFMFTGLSTAVMTSIIFLYAFSRTAEVFFAFLFDALRVARGEDPTSELTKEERLKLALWSYVSIVVDFSLLFWFLKDGLNKTFTTPIQALYFSAVSIATIGYGDYYPNDLTTQSCVIYEIACGLILLVVSLGIYVGQKNDVLTNQNTQFSWRNVLLRKFIQACRSRKFIGHGIECISRALQSLKETNSRARDIFNHLFDVDTVALDLKYIFDYVRNYGIAAVLFYSGIYIIFHGSLNIFLESHISRLIAGICIAATAVILAIFNFLHLMLVLNKKLAPPFLVIVVIGFVIFLISCTQFEVLAMKQLDHAATARANADVRPTYVGPMEAAPANITVESWVLCKGNAGKAWCGAP